jgi:anti-sigma factor RsiW
MNGTCRDVDARLDDWIDGACDATERERIEAHLATCAACRARAAEIRTIVDAARRLPREVDLPRDLLPGIRARARARRPGRAALGILAAASVAIAGVTAWLVLAPERPAEPIAEAPDAPFRLAAEQFEVAAAGLESSLGTLTPETRAVLDRNLDILDAAIAEASRALDVRPADPRNGRMLTALHRRKVDLLWRVSRLSDRT